MIEKADRSDMPVITPGRAMGRMISKDICSRPKNLVRAIAADTSVPSTSAKAVEIAATCRVTAAAGQVIGGQNREEGGDEHHHGDDVGDRALSGADEFLQHPDRQGRLLTCGDRKSVV